MKFEWVQKTGRFQNGEKLLSSGIVLADYSRDAVSRSDSRPYRIATNLPGHVLRIERYATERDAKLALEKSIIDWFARFK